MINTPTRRLVSPSVLLGLLILATSLPPGRPGRCHSDGICRQRWERGGRSSFGTFGTVDYEYQIGATEITNAQYTEFPNAKVKSEPLNLYPFLANTNCRDGIRQVALCPSLYPFRFSCRRRKPPAGQAIDQGEPMRTGYRRRIFPHLDQAKSLDRSISPCAARSRDTATGLGPSKKVQ